MRWIELLLMLLLYLGGYSRYTAGDQAGTICFAIGSAILLWIVLADLWRGRYVNMSLKKIDKLSGRAFEEYLIVQFKRLGYRVRLTEASHDYGADLILKKRGECIVVQAKRYENNVGISAVQEVVGSIAYYQADRAIVVTNRYFTKNAQRLAWQNDVELWNREEIIRRFHIRRS